RYASHTKSNCLAASVLLRWFIFLHHIAAVRCIFTTLTAGAPNLDRSLPGVTHTYLAHDTPGVSVAAERREEAKVHYKLKRCGELMASGLLSAVFVIVALLA
ncbi:hypothetical protein O3P69_014146, partial [Scylla paramamosain]